MSRDTNAPFKLTEWIWFKTQLRLYSLERERRSPLFGVYFDINDEQRTIVCGLYHSRLEDIFRETTDKEILYEEYFSGWVRTQRRAIANILRDLPTLGGELDSERDVVYQILSNYGTGSTLVCTFTGNEVSWNSIVLEDLKDSTDSIQREVDTPEVANDDS